MPPPVASGDGRADGEAEAATYTGTRRLRRGGIQKAPGLALAGAVAAAALALRGLVVAATDRRHVLAVLNATGKRIDALVAGPYDQVVAWSPDISRLGVRPIEASLAASHSLTGVAPSAGTAAPPTLADGLERVHGALLDAVAADDAFLTEVAGHLIKAGGKRQRPAFAMASALTATPRAGAVTREVMLGGVAVELVHLGSLYHDDVMDEATTRHFVESVNARWGNLQAILAGDYLLAKASEIAASLGTEVAGLLAATIARLCEGQLTELQDTFNAARTEERYVRSIEGKTAALFATACRIGAIVAGLPREDIDALTTFGQAYGMAFQIVDDVLDVVATDEELGKPSGHDMVEGTYTLPVLRVLASDDRGELKQLLGSPLSDDDRIVARDLVRAHPTAVASSIVDARSHADRAVAALGTAADTESGAWLVATAEGLLTKVEAAAR